MASNNDAVGVYFSALAEKYKTGQAREHAYRPAFEVLVHALDPSLKILNDPSRSEHGNPDFVFLRGDITAGYAETKDIGVDLDKTEKSEQMERYLGYSNLILTDYLEFRFFRNGSPHGEPVRIGAVETEKLVANEKAFDELADALADFLTGKPEPIKSGKRLAEIMGGKARRIRDNVQRFLATESDKNTELLRLYQAIGTQLVHDLTPGAFADMYAQTLVYGLFAARYNDDSPETFSRREAQELVPASNPFLRNFFDHIAGVNFDRRLGFIVDELCDVFRVSTVQELIDEYYENDSAVASKDQIIHFYEDFLNEYDAELRKKMGAYYTPLPVVCFIVRAVDSLLKSEFDLSEGFADTSKLPNGLHKVQVLDPAVGTGTFISEVIGTIYRKLLKNGQKGRWPAYVHHDLLPRLYGFELMMAPYTIAHLKLSLAFKKTGFRYFNETRQGKARLKIYLTNSLEQAGPQTDIFSLGFAQSIAEEAKQAAVIKSDTPIMVVLGNPPYSVSSSNKGLWIQELIRAYKKGLGEKKINLDDDYIKFIRFAEHFIEKNKAGIVAMITNNSFIDGITHRQMRKHLLETFDRIYILNLHGNSLKGELTPDGGKDENVFDIKQGVSINIFIRSNEHKEKLASIYHSEMWGKREEKFQELDSFSIDDKKWKKLNYSEPNYFFVPKDFSLQEDYRKGFYLKDIIHEYSTGIETQDDETLLGYSSEDLVKRIHLSLEGQLKKRKHVFYLEQNGIDETKVVKIMHKPFDYRWTYLDSHVLGRARLPFMLSLTKQNLALACARQYTSRETSGALVSNVPAAHKSFSANDKTVLFPIYLYTEDGSRVSNLNKEIVADIEKIVGKTTPEDIFDYIYALLHSRSYREKYKEFLKIDFPRVPYPKDKKQFVALTKLGKELRELHLLESPKVRQYITSYPESGSNVVEKIARKGDKVYINASQYFGNLPEVAWNFYIGGYQPAQKWLKDHKGRTLSNDDIEHYQQIIVVLVETDKIMREIDD